MSVIQELEEKNRKLDEATVRNRSNALNAIYRIMLLSGSIVAFSLTIVSTDLITAKIDLHLLYNSWITFLIVIIIGTIMLFIEPRIEQARAWRYYMQYANAPTDEELGNLQLKEKCEIFKALVKSLIFPENLIFDKIQENEEKRRKNQVKSFLLLHNIAKFRMFVIYGLEVLFYVIFICALMIFIHSIKL